MHFLINFLIHFELHYRKVLSDDKVALLYLRLIFFKRFIYLLLDRGEGRGKEKERNINVWLPLVRPPLSTWPETQARTLTRNQTGEPFGLQAGVQSTEPHQPGHFFSLIIKMNGNFSSKEFSFSLLRQNEW